MHPRLRTRLFLEPLEGRCCPAFLATVVDGSLLVTATEAVALQVYPVDSDSFVVDELFSQTYAVIDNVTKDVTIRLSNENDMLEFDLAGFATPGDVEVYLGDGDNYFALNGVFALPGTIDGNLEIYGGAGQDLVLLGSNSTWTHVSKNMLIDTGSGNDSVWVGFAGFVNLFGKVEINMGDGDDYLGMLDTALDKKVTIELGDGNDTCAVNGVFSGKVDIDLGAGDDAFIVGPAVFYKKARVDGGLGVDVFYGSNIDIEKLNFEIDA